MKKRHKDFIKVRYIISTLILSCALIALSVLLILDEEYVPAISLIVLATVGIISEVDYYKNPSKYEIDADNNSSKFEK